MLTNFRRYYNLTKHAAIVTGQITNAWKFLRQYTLFLNKTYSRLKIIAEKKKAKIPKPLVNMDAEQ